MWSQCRQSRPYIMGLPRAMDAKAWRQLQLNSITQTPVNLNFSCRCSWKHQPWSALHFEEALACIQPKITFCLILTHLILTVLCLGFMLHLVSAGLPWLGSGPGPWGAQGATRGRAGEQAGISDLNKEHRKKPKGFSLMGLWMILWRQGWLQALSKLG